MFRQVVYNSKAQSKDRNNSNESSEIEEALYLEIIQKQVQKILASLNIDRKDSEQKFKLKYQQLELKIEQKSTMLEEVKDVNNTLKNENYNLRLNLQQMERNLKRNQLKQDNMLRQIQSLKKIVVQKEAIIKYLEEKNFITSFLNSQNVTANKQTTTINLKGYPKTGSQKDLSFSRLKQTKYVHFENFNFKQPLKNIDIQPKKSVKNRKNSQPKQKINNMQVSKGKKDQISQNVNNRVDSEIFSPFHMSDLKNKKSRIKKLSRKNSAQMINSLLNCSTNFKLQNAKQAGKTVFQQDVLRCRNEDKNSSLISRCRTQN